MKTAQHKDPNVAALMRVVTLLLSMAGFARRASARSAPVRFLVYLFVSRAETAALAFFDVPADEAAPGMPVLPSPSDLLFLSARLRGLALLLAQTCGMGLWTDEAPPAPRAAVQTLLAPAALPPRRAPFHDTS